MDSDDQLIHVSRYIHLNPVVSSLVDEDRLDEYPYSSLPEYLENTEKNICNTEMLRGHFKSAASYRSFIYDQINYAKTLHTIHEVMIDTDYKG